MKLGKKPLPNTYSKQPNPKITRVIKKKAKNLIYIRLKISYSPFICAQKLIVPIQ